MLFNASTPQIAKQIPPIMMILWKFMEVLCIVMASPSSMELALFQ